MWILWNQCWDLNEVDLTPHHLLQHTSSKDIWEHGHKHEHDRFVNWLRPHPNPASFEVWSLSEKSIISVNRQLDKRIISKETPTVSLAQIKFPIKNQPAQLPPHIDRGRKAAINIYISTGQDVTNFWSTSKNNFHVINCFKAQSGQSFLLDVRQPHSVDLSGHHIRTIITLSFKKMGFSDLAEYNLV